jgi:lipopolysaccharide export system permease protein
MTLPRLLVGYLVRRLLATFAVCLGAVVGIYLVIDFADRAKLYTGAGVAGAVAELYAMKGVLLAYQLTPAALLLASGACISGLRRQGETTALSALSVSPRVLYASVALASLAVVAGAVGLDQVLVPYAGPRVDEIAASRFHQWGDFSVFYAQKKWFRSGEHVYFLRELDGEGFRDVSIYTLASDFTLTARLDAAAMAPLPDGRWRFTGGAERTFGGPGQSAFRAFDAEDRALPEPPGTFQIARGRPEQMALWTLSRQVALRARLGLPVTAYVLALHQKLAYPLMGLPAALLTAGLALRRGRSGHLTAALLEGVAVVGLLWGGNVLFKAAASAGHLSAATAAWLPLVLLSAAAWTVGRRSA